ncbi:MAG: hypothetical protein E7052_11580 [Lentisphaerae bacterium]|nr:hypothetical protein [Lentisphaerota bacterium]
MNKINFFGRELNVYKANLHTHTDKSYCFDAEKNIRLYAQANYDVLAFTDHEYTSNVSQFDSMGMLLLSGIELHPAGPRGILWHLLALGVPVDFPGKFASAQAAVDAVHAVNGVIYCAHPHWCGITSQDILAVKSFDGIEVYNSSTRFIGKEYNDQCWDELIDSGMLCGALAVDDTHRAHHLFHGWTMIAAAEKTPEAIIDALKNNRYYATQGPEIKRMELKNRTFIAEFSEVCEVNLVGQHNSGFYAISPGDPDVGDNITTSSCSIEIPEKFHGALRLRIRSCAGKYAWSTPFVVD